MYPPHLAHTQTWRSDCAIVLGWLGPKNEARAARSRHSWSDATPSRDLGRTMGTDVPKPMYIRKMTGFRGYHGMLSKASPLSETPKGDVQWWDFSCRPGHHHTPGAAALLTPDGVTPNSAECN